MITLPKVSIVIPVFNGANYLRESIESALKQTYENVEILVVNDGSRDDGATEKIAYEYGDKIRYLVKENGGVASALNLAIEEMSGDYLSWLSHDDLYFPDKIQTQVEAILALNADDVILYSDFGVFYENPSNLKIYHLTETSPENFRYTLTVNSSLNGCTLLVPKSAFEKCGVFDLTLRYAQDYDLWFRLASKFRFIHLSKILVMSRSHPQQDSVKMKKEMLVEINRQVLEFLNALSPLELRRGNNYSASIAYAIISTKFYLRGIEDAARIVLNMALKQAESDSFTDRLVVRGIRLHVLYALPLYRNLRDFVKKIVRGKIGKWFKI